jgi:glutamyl-tRNA reductase
VTHKRASVQILEALSFQKIKEAAWDILEIDGVNESLILRTCNRIEIFVSCSDDKTIVEEKIIDYWSKRKGFHIDELESYLDVSSSSDALLHLIRLTSGLESLVVGEDQILGQVQDSISEANNIHTIGPVLNKIFARAVKIGKMIRVKTEVNKGSVSLGSIAINMLESVAGDLDKKKVLILGAGKIGALAGKALAARNLALIFIANRTYDKAISLSKKLNAEAVKYDRLIEYLSKVDIVLVATSAPHYILTRDKVAEALRIRQKSENLIILDLSLPRNTEKNVGELNGIEFHDIDNLRTIADENLRMRQEESRKAEVLVQVEMDRILSLQKKIDVEPVIKAVSRQADHIRKKEVEKAYRLMKTDPTVKRCGHCRTVMDNLSKVLLERIMLDPIISLRNAEIDSDIDKISVIQEIFKVNTTEGID